jgi:hypothetical protein
MGVRRASRTPYFDAQALIAAERDGYYSCGLITAERDGYYS